MMEKVSGRLADATGLAGAEAPEPDKPSRPDGDIPSAEAAYHRGRYVGMIEALRLTHTPEEMAAMGFV